MNVLFVCTGNTCRSAMAEGLLRKQALEQGRKDVAAASCGTEASPLYRVPPDVLQFMAKRGVDMKDHRSTQITRRVAVGADLILAMEEPHRAYVVEHFPKERAKVFLLKEYVGETKDPEIPDPIGRPAEVYRRTGEEIEGYVRKLLEKI